MSNPLKDHFDNNKTRIINKWSNYFDVYHENFQKFRGKKINFLEIGVNHGGSLNMWKEYFGNNATIYGIDINPECKAFEKENVQIRIGSQIDKEFLQNVVSEVNGFDIILDDGSHMVSHQIDSFEILFEHINEGGKYVVEDTHTSYWIQFGGGVKRRGSFIEYTKNLIDRLHAHHINTYKFPSISIKDIYSIQFYDSILVIEKRKKSNPENLKSGSIPVKRDEEYFKDSGISKNRMRALIYINRILAKLRLPAYKLK